MLPRPVEKKARSRDSSLGLFFPVPRLVSSDSAAPRLASRRIALQIMEVHTDDYKRIFGGSDGPGAACSEVVPEGALFLPQGGADAAAEEVCGDAKCLLSAFSLFVVRLRFIFL